MTPVHAAAARNIKNAVESIKTVLLGGFGIQYYIIAILLVVTDQITKRYALSVLGEGRTLFYRTGFIRFTLVKNRGAALGLLKHKPVLLRILTMLLILVAAAYLVYSAVSSGPVLLLLSLSFILGGAAGNLIDRFSFGYVIDFVTLKIKRFPVFNAADVFILAGTILYAAYSLFNTGL